MDGNIAGKENENKNKNEEDSFRRNCLNDWHETWAAFNIALRSTDEFNVLEWTFKLIKSGICFCYFKIGLYKLKFHIHWRSWVPALAIALVGIVVFSYFRSIREIVNERWCCPILGTKGVASGSDSRVDNSGSCRWLLFHDTVVAYLGFMIIFNFLSACFRSPGVVLAKQQQMENGENKESIITNSLDGRVQEKCRKWSSKESRGGFCCIDPILNIANEELLVQKYYNIAALSRGSGKISTNIGREKKENQDFPCSRHTFCNKCMIKRPPRCRHCSICDRCVLQFDHHCVWLNNCVGYNNHRAFVLTLFFLNLGCWYGIFMLYRPFLEVMNKSSDDYGWHFFHENISSIFELPSLSTILPCILSGSMDKETMNKVVFPFLLAIGLLQAVFFGYHILYVVSALTTLEYKILLDMQFNHLAEHTSSFITPQNPFSRGCLQNLKNALGPIYLVFFPIQVDPKPIKPTSNRSS